MHSSSTTLSCSSLGRLITRLCKHWGHRFDVKFNEQQGEIDFGDCRCRLNAGDTQLHIALTCDDAERLAPMQQVVIDHLERMSKETLPEAIWH